MLAGQKTDPVSSGDGERRKRETRSLDCVFMHSESVVIRPGLVFVAGIDSIAKSTMGREMVSLASRIRSVLEGSQSSDSQGRNLEPGTEAETPRACCLLAPFQAHLHLSSAAQDHLSKESTYCPLWAELLYIH